MFKTINADALDQIIGGMGSRGAPAAAPQKPAAAPAQPTEAGNICRDAYAGAGGVIGGALTSETLGWGAIPGAIAGGMAGRAICPN